MARSGIHAVLLLSLLAGLAGGCYKSSAASDPAASHPEVAAVFTTFQDALLRGDRSTVRRLLTRESRRFVDRLAWRSAADKQPLILRSIEQRDYAFHAHCEDPNQDGQPARFILVKEQGRIRVDLVRTTAYHHTHHQKAGPREVVRQKPLTRREIERIRALSKEAIR